MTREELMELKEMVHIKSEKLVYDEDIEDYMTYEIEDKDLMRALESCEKLIDSELACLSVTDGDAREAIEILHDWNVENIHDPSVGIWQDEDMAKAIPLAITALEQMKSKGDSNEYWNAPGGKLQI